MKFIPAGHVRGIDLSPPMRGAWIEMAFDVTCEYSSGSPPMRGAWIEMILTA